MNQVNTTKSGIGYKILGQGIPVVILRGLGRTIKHWLGFEEVLAKFYRVIAVDLRGVGCSPKKLFPKATIWDLAEDIKEVLDEAGVDRAHILGVSLGGMVTLALGIKYPKICRSLIVINTSVGGLRTLRIYPRVIAALGLKGLRNNPDIELDLAKFLVGSSLTKQQVDEIGEKHRQIFMSEPNVVPIVAMQLIAALRFKPIRQLLHLRVPTLVLYGTEDRFVPNVNSIKVASLIPDSKLIPIEGAGHEVTFDCEDKLLEILGEWITPSQPA